MFSGGASFLKERDGRGGFLALVLASFELLRRLRRAFALPDGVSEPKKRCDAECQTIYMVK